MDGLNFRLYIWDNVVYEANGDDFQDERGQPLGSYSGSGGGQSAASEFSDTDFLVYDGADYTKQVQLDVSGVTTGNTRTLTVPDANGTIALVSQIITQHNNLSGIQGGTTSNYYHLTSAQLTTLTTGITADSLHIHESHTLQESYNVSTSPQILTNSTIGGIVFQNGVTGGDVDPIFSIRNYAGATSLSITSAGTLTIGSVSGVLQATNGVVGATTTLSDGTTAITQSLDDNSTKVATTAYVDSSITDFVVGPTTSNNTAVALFNGTTGKLLSTSNITVDSEGNVNIPGDVNIGGSLNYIGAIADHTASLSVLIIIVAIISISLKFRMLM